MKKLMRIFCIVLCLALLSGCVEKAKPTPESVLAVINGTELTLGEFNAQYSTVKEYYMMNQGVDLDAPEHADMNVELKLEFLDAIITQTALQQDIEKLGLDTFTEEEEKMVAAEAEVRVWQYAEIFRQQLGDMPDEQVDAIMPQLLIDNGVTVETLSPLVKRDVMQMRHQEYITRSTTVSESEILRAFEQYKVDMAADIEQSRAFFPNAWNNNLLLTNVAKGFSVFEWILVPIDPEKAAELNALQLSKDASYEAKKAAYLAEIEVQSQAALDRVMGGEDFKTVQAEFGNGDYYDSENPPQHIGYCISEYNEVLPYELKVAAALMKDDGEITKELVGGNEGYFIVMRIRAITDADAATSEIANEALYETTLNSSKQKVYDFYLQALSMAAEVTKNEDYLK